jgi:hypothetical protein
MGSLIVKQVSMKSAKKSSFAGLAKYITDEQDKSERVGHVTVTNCQSDRADFATTEVLNTQAQNTRATSDKTYHLIVSFRAGEQPDDAILKAIEDRLCAGLGYGDHQRISAVHHDTDNLHIHIAINKIHPTRYTMHEPYYPHKILAKLCDKLEREYGLEQDNHLAQKVGAENMAADMERHAGVESLLGWIKRECRDQIQGAQSWAELHQVMLTNGLELHARGNGLVVTADNGVTVKASSIAREFSMSKLEARFGIFEPSPERQAHQKPARKYERKPMRSRINTVELHSRYKNEQQNSGALRTAEWAKAIAKKNRLIEDAKRSGRLKRSVIKLIKGAGPGRAVMYASTSKTMKEEIQTIGQQYLKERQEIYDKYQRLAWADWLRAEATGGDPEALGALRAREANQGIKSNKGNTVTGKERKKPATDRSSQDSITKKGTIIYRAGRTAVRDDGDKLNVSRGADQNGLQAVLLMATERYGERITVNGTAAFKEQIAQAAAAARLAIIFDDAALERRHQQLLQSTTKENTHEHARADRGRADSSRHGGTGFPVAGNKRTAGTDAGRVRPGAARPAVPGRGHDGKPDIGRIGCKPPPQGQNRLRGLSELGVVFIAGRGEVLLPGHVPGHLEQQGTKPDNGVRRDIFGTGTVTPGFAEADKYIAEREATRLKVFDMPKHARYNHCNDGAVAFAGMRHVEGQALALLKRGEEIMVLPIDEASARRLKRVAVGEEVTVTPKGAIKTKGRSR